MKVLVACEESQTVCTAFRSKGHDAYSCDIQDCSGGHPEWHIQSDVVPLLDGYCSFFTSDGNLHFLPGKWDMIIAHPPCTYLSTAATHCHSLKCFSQEEIAARTLKRIEAMQFFMLFVHCNCDKVVVENPTGVMNTCYRQPDQSIHPYFFAKGINDSENYFTKKTGLWLKGVEPLKFTCSLPNPIEFSDTWKSGKKKNWTEAHHGSKLRSKTFPGIAQAMADQWGSL